MHNEVKLSVPSGISGAVGHAVDAQERAGHNRDEIFREPLISQVAEAALSRLVINPDTPENRRFAKRYVYIELGNRA